MQSVYSIIDMNGLEIRNSRAHVLTSDPVEFLFEGVWYWNAAEKVVKFYDAGNEEWKIFQSLPAASPNQTLRHDGGNWAVSNVLESHTNKVVVIGTNSDGAVAIPSFQVEGAFMTIGDFASGRTFANGSGIKFNDSGASHYSIVHTAGELHLGSSGASSALSIDANSIAIKAGAGKVILGHTTTTTAAAPTAAYAGSTLGAATWGMFEGSRANKTWIGAPVSGSFQGIWLGQTGATSTNYLLGVDTATPNIPSINVSSVGRINLVVNNGASVIGAITPFGIALGTTDSTAQQYALNVTKPSTYDSYSAQIINGLKLDRNETVTGSGSWDSKVINISANGNFSTVSGNSQNFRGMQLDLATTLAPGALGNVYSYAAGFSSVVTNDVYYTHAFRSDVYVRGASTRWAQYYTQFNRMDCDGTTTADRTFAGARYDLAKTSSSSHGFDDASGVGVSLGTFDVTKGWRDVSGFSVSISGVSRDAMGMLISNVVNANAPTAGRYFTGFHSRTFNNHATSSVFAASELVLENSGLITNARGIQMSMNSVSSGVARAIDIGGNWGTSSNYYGLFINIPSQNFISGSLGLGTSNPTAKLHVQGTVRFTSFLGTPTTIIGVNGSGEVGSLSLASYFSISGGQLQLAGAPFVQGGNSFGAVALLGTNDNQPLHLETNGTVRVRVQTNGRVDIGGNGGNELLNLFAGNISVGDNYGMVGEFSGSTWTPIISRAGSNVQIGGTGNSNVTLFAGTAQRFLFTSDGRLRYNTLFSSDPTSPALSNGDTWFNSTRGRQTHQIAGISKDVAYVDDELDFSLFVYRENFLKTNQLPSNWTYSGDPSTSSSNSFQFGYGSFAVTTDTVGASPNNFAALYQDASLIVATSNRRYTASFQVDLTSFNPSPTNTGDIWIGIGGGNNTNASDPDDFVGFRVNPGTSGFRYSFVVRKNGTSTSVSSSDITSGLKELRIVWTNTSVQFWENNTLLFTQTTMTNSPTGESGMGLMVKSVRPSGGSNYGIGCFVGGVAIKID